MTMARGKAIVPRNGGDHYTLELPMYAVRYLAQMCNRERAMLTSFAAMGAPSIAIEAASDALTQIEKALP